MFKKSLELKHFLRRAATYLKFWNSITLAYYLNMRNELRGFIKASLRKYFWYGYQQFHAHTYVCVYVFKYFFSRTPNGLLILF